MCVNVCFVRACVFVCAFECVGARARACVLVCLFVCA